jgi:hypothetical protein
MKNRFIVSLALLVWMGGALFSAQNGFISFEYAKGQEQSEAELGIFRNIEAGILFSGSLAPRFDFLTELSFEYGGGYAIEQALLGYRASEAFVLKFGLFAVPFGSFNETNRPHLNPLVSTPLNVDYLLPRRWKDVGIVLEGTISGIFYSAYIGNGIGEDEDLASSQLFLDNNMDKGRGGKVGIYLGQGVDVSYSRYWGRYDGDNTRDCRMQALAANWLGRGFQAHFERIWTVLQNPMDWEDGEASGYYVQAAFDVDNLQPFVSLQTLSYQDPFHGPGFVPDQGGEGIALDKTRWAAGLIYFPAPGILFKFEYDWNKDNNSEIQDNVYVFQVAVSF